MSKQILTPEIVSLIHHLELNKAGWWDSSVEIFITIHLHATPGGLTTNELVDTLRSNYEINIDPDQCGKTLEKLQKKNIVIKYRDDKFKLTEAELLKSQEKISAFCKLETKVKNKFGTIISQLVTSSTDDDIWSRFNRDFLAPYIQETGAKVYEIISGEILNLNGKKCLERFLKNFNEEHHEALKKAIIDFFNPQDADIRAYIHKQLRAFFCIDAAKLNKSSVESITTSLSKPAKFKIFLDTNFLFSILNLHDNPANEAAKILVSTIQELKTKLNISLYISPMTVEESNAVLIYQVEKLKGLNLSAHISEILENSPSLSGLTIKFINANRESQKKLTPEEFFSPYINNLQLLSREHGVELYNKKVDSYRKDQSIIDEILLQMKFEKERGYKTPKTYEQLEHDITLMSLIKDLRSSSIENPLDAIYWIATIDYRLLAYDKYKQKTNRIGLCIHPTTLIQMLQLWIPRNDTLEQALIGNLRLPLLALQDFDKEAEEVTLNILGALSAYENVGDLDKTTITQILVNKNLRQHLTKETPLDEKIELVHSALIEEHQKVASILKAKEEENKHLQTIVRSKEIENSTILEKLQVFERKQLDLDDVVTQEKARSTKLELELAGIKEKNIFLRYFLIIPLLFMSVLTFLTYKASLCLGLNKYIPSTTIALLLLTFWIHAAERRAKKVLNLLKSDIVCTLFVKSKKILLWTFGAIFLTIIIGFFVNFSTEIIKDDLPAGKITYENIRNWAITKLKSDNKDEN